MTAEEWLGGANERVSTVSLDPSKAPKPSPKVTAAKSSKEGKATTLTDVSVFKGTATSNTAGTAAHWL